MNSCPRESRARRDAYERALAFTRFSPRREAAARSVDPSTLPVKSFIDEEIFGKLSAQNVPAAMLSSDAEFIRRIMLDLTGRIPAGAEVRAFAADENPGKRDALIDRLLYSPEFTDKWTMWLGDLLQNAATAQNRSQQIEGRNRLHEWIKGSIDSQKSFRDVAYQVITAVGNNFDRDTAASNFILRGFAPMGPAQDTADLLMMRTASIFLGLSHYDCLLCHDGRYHLDAVSAWGAKATRLEAWRMASHFTRVQMAGVSNERTDYYYNSILTTERTTGNYNLNTSSGNRPQRGALTIENRQVTSLTPVYRDGTAAAGQLARVLRASDDRRSDVCAELRKPVVEGDVQPGAGRTGGRVGPSAAGSEGGSTRGLDAPGIASGAAGETRSGGARQRFQPEGNAEADRIVLGLPAFFVV